MKFPWKALAWILLHSINASLAQVGLVLSPAEFTASLNNEEVNYTCSVSPSTLEIDVISRSVDGDQVSGSLPNRGITFIKESGAGILRIQAREENDNITIRCIVVPTSGDPPVIRSEPALLRVQGLLSAPPDLEVMVSDSSPSFNSLSWSAPFTLDITNQEPDITGYRVCSNYSATSTCAMTDSTSYEFLNVRLPVEYLVTAINAVGESNASIISHPACDPSAGEFRGWGQNR